MRLEPKTSFKTSFTPKIDIPEGFILIQDTREQKPLFSSKPWIIESGLSEGDYSIKGFEKLISIERKSINDLKGSLGTGRERFERELKRLQDYTWKGLLVERRENEIYSSSNGFSGLHPNAIYHSIAAMEIKYQLHIYYAPTRAWARWWVLSRLSKFYKYIRKGEI